MIYIKKININWDFESTINRVQSTHFRMFNEIDTRPQCLIKCGLRGNKGMKVIMQTSQTPLHQALAPVGSSLSQSCQPPENAFRNKHENYTKFQEHQQKFQERLWCRFMSWVRTNNDFAIYIDNTTLLLLTTFANYQIVNTFSHIIVKPQQTFC